MVTNETFKYDAFISHAVEDKFPIANELCARLEQAGLKIWYSGRELRVGDRLTTAIEQGLSKSRFGIVILSPTYVSKMWTLREFYSLLSREEHGKKTILPILYDITPEQLAQKDLTMAELFSIRADKGMDYVVNVLVNEIRETQKAERRRSFAWARNFLGAAIAGLVMLFSAGCYWLGYLNGEAGAANVAAISESGHPAFYYTASESGKKGLGFIVIPVTPVQGEGFSEIQKAVLRSKATPPDDSNKHTDSGEARRFAMTSLDPDR